MTGKVICITVSLLFVGIGFLAAGSFVVGVRQIPIAVALLVMMYCWFGAPEDEARPYGLVGWVIAACLLIYYADKFARWLCG